MLQCHYRILLEEAPTHGNKCKQLLQKENKSVASNPFRTRQPTEQPTTQGIMGKLHLHKFLLQI